MGGESHLPLHTSNLSFAALWPGTWPSDRLQRGVPGHSDFCKRREQLRVVPGDLESLQGKMMPSSPQAVFNKGLILRGHNKLNAPSPDAPSRKQSQAFYSCQSE